MDILDKTDFAILVDGVVSLVYALVREHTKGNAKNAKTDVRRRRRCHRSTLRRDSPSGFFA
jgi:hypothetical protein